MATGGRGRVALEAVILAAGSAKRFGGGKLTAPWCGGVLIDGALAAAFQAPVRAVTVVTGAEAASVEAAVESFGIESGLAESLRLVRAPDHSEGMAASLRAGIASLPLDVDGAFVFLGDMPRVPRQVLLPLARAIAQGHAAAAPVFQGRRGHPAVFARALFPDLVALQGDQGAKAILDRLGPSLPLIEAPDDGILFDVDERSDLPR